MPRNKEEQYVKDWITSARAAKLAFDRFIRALEGYPDHIRDHDKVLKIYRDMADAGLEGFLDGHPLSIDKLADVLVRQDHQLNNITQEAHNARARCPDHLEHRHP